MCRLVLFCEEILVLERTGQLEESVNLCGASVESNNWDPYYVLQQGVHLLKQSCLKLNGNIVYSSCL